MVDAVFGLGSFTTRRYLRSLLERMKAGSIDHNHRPRVKVGGWEVAKFLEIH